MKDQTVTVIANRQISPDYYEIRFDWKQAYGEPRAGQFMELRVTDATAPLLRRPFAFSDFDASGETAAMIYQVRGQSTQMLAAKRPGETVRILAPLGNAFGLDGQPEKVIAVAGGVGLGPILMAALDMQRAGSEVKFVTGFRHQDLIPDRDLWSNLTDSVVCTDDGSEGFAGNVVEYLRTLPDQDLSDARILACGPDPMLRAAHFFAREKGLVCETSVEEMMACGLGVCVGCVVTLKDGGSARVCTDGPIFDSEVLAWN
jgi:dihydroorotate dehydrogenase electron transfer subunit